MNELPGETFRNRGGVKAMSESIQGQVAQKGGIKAACLLMPLVEVR